MKGAVLTIDNLPNAGASAKPRANGTPSGAVGPVTPASGSSCAPGNFGPGRLTELGDLALTAGSTFSAVLSGVNNFSQLGVQGAVSLGGATLAVGRNFSPADNTVFLILTNDGPDAIVGTFANLPEGGYVTNGNFAFRISYVGGTGNDITLTSANISGPPAPTPGPRFWTGAAGNALWSNPANWSNSIAPVAGDTLFFHGAGGASSNDIATSRHVGCLQAFALPGQPIKHREDAAVAAIHSESWLHDFFHERNDADLRNWALPCARCLLGSAANVLQHRAF